jgi:HEAT repeat protein
MNAQVFALDVEIQTHKDCRPLISSLVTALPLAQKALELSVMNIRPCRCPKDPFTDLGVRRDFIVSRSGKPMSSPNDVSQVVREELRRHLEDLRDLRSEIPSLALIYPRDQNNLKSGFVGQKWALKLCCMYPGGEHPLEVPENHKEGETNPAFGIYYLEDLGELTGPIIKWMSSKAKIAKVVFPRLGGFFEWVEKNEVTRLLKSAGEKAKDISLPESQLPRDGKFLPISSEYITLAGLNDRDYREIEGQGLIFLQQVIQKHGRCGNLSLFVNSEGRKLWLCREHEALMKAERGTATAVAAGRRTEELWIQYRERLSANVSKVRLLGESEWRELKQVFVKLNIVEEYQRPSARNEWMGFVDAEIRKRRALFSATADDGEEDEEKKEKRLIEPEELLRDGTRAVVTGAPGCGKSTLLRWLARTCLDENAPRLPVFLELKSINKKLFDDCGGNLGDLLFEQAVAPLLHFADQPERATLKSAFITRLAAHRVAIFIDGLDEVRNTDFFAPLCEAINGFLDSSYGRNLLLISTRPYALDVRFRNAQEMEIAPLNQAQVADFLKHYYGADPRFDLRGLLQQLGRRELGEMVRVPVLLGALVRRYREKGELTGDRLKLYEDLVHDLVVTRDAENNVERFEVKDEDGLCKLEFLEQVAFKKLFIESSAQDDEPWTFTTRWLFDEAKAYCPQFNIKPQDFVADVKATALLREVGKGVWAFSHLTIQEYLGARALVVKADCERIFCLNYFNPTLVEMEALPMALGLLKEPDEMYSAIEQLPESLNFAGLRLRARGLAYSAGISNDLQKRLADRLIDFIGSGRTEERAYLPAIIHSFSGIGSNYSGYIGERVSQLLKSEASGVRLSATGALGKIGGEQAVTALIKALHDKDRGVRERAAEALNKIGREQAVTALIKALKSENRRVRARAAETLNKIGREQAVTALIKALKSEDRGVRKGAAEALNKIGEEQMLAALIKDKVLGMRLNAAEMLGKIVGEQAVAALIEALNDKASFVRKRIAMALGKIVEEQPVAALIKNLKSEDDTVRWRAAGALRKIGGEQAVAALIEALNDKALCVRMSAVEALGKIGGEQAVTALIEALKSENGDVRESTAGTLGKIGGEQMVASLIEALKDEDGDVRLRAAYALGKIRGEQAVASLIEALKDEDGNVRGSAAYALGKIGGEQAVASLIEALKDEDGGVRGSAAYALGKIGEEQAVASLIEALKDEDGDVRGGAAYALEQIKVELLAKGLQSAISHTNSFVRRKTAEVIGYYSNKKEGLKLLAETDPVSEVKQAAESALSRLESKKKYFGNDQ